MTDLVFYTNPMSRGRIAHWMFEELGEDYQTVWVEYGEQMKSPDYLAINPMGKVPAMTYKGAVVTEAPAICAALAALYPEKGLMPAAGDPALAVYYRWLFFAAGPLEAAITARTMGWEVPEDRKPTVGFGSLESIVDAIEAAIKGSEGDYICGDQFSACDVYVGSHLNWGMSFETIEKRPVFEEYVGRLLQRPASARANEINEKRMAQNA